MQNVKNSFRFCSSNTNNNISLVSSNQLNNACMNNYAKLNSDVIEYGDHHQWEHAINTTLYNDIWKHIYNTCNEHNNIT